jgi:PadR family transcriptional regulator, regulatory protein PadR
VSINSLSFMTLVALAREPMHGYALRGEIEAMSGEAPQVATLYRTLDRLDADGLVVEHSSEVVDGRFRRRYELTDLGRRRLSEEAARRAATARLATKRLRAGGWTLAPQGGLT